MYGKPELILTPAACDKLKVQPWYGNIRELEHIIEKAVIISDGKMLDADDFDFPSAAPPSESPPNDATTLEEMECHMIRRTMDKHRGNLSLVASELGISRQTLYNKIKRYGL